MSVGAAVSAGSVALLGFGVDSFVESVSGAILIWHLLAERASHAERIEHAERRAQRLVGMVVTTVSIVAMLWLGRAKRDLAHTLGSRALDADASQTPACLWLAVLTLAGIALNAAFGWWWADPVAALGMVYFIAAEARRAWRGEECGHA